MRARTATLLTLSLALLFSVTAEAQLVYNGGKCGGLISVPGGQTVRFIPGQNPGPESSLDLRLFGDLQRHPHGRRGGPDGPGLHPQGRRPAPLPHRGLIRSPLPGQRSADSLRRNRGRPARGADMQHGCLRALPSEGRPPAQPHDPEPRLWQPQGTDLGMASNDTEDEREHHVHARQRTDQAGCSISPEACTGDACCHPLVIDYALRNISGERVHPLRIRRRQVPTISTGTPPCPPP